MTNTSEPAEVTLNMQYIRDMSLEVPHAPEIFPSLIPNQSSTLI